jgi:hypothetical protein
MHYQENPLIRSCTVALLVAVAVAAWSGPAAAGGPDLVGAAAVEQVGDRLGLDLTPDVPSFRLEGRTRAGWFATSHFYIDVDLHALRWPKSWILMPASLGLEAVVGRTSVFLEAGVGVSLRGLETFSPLLPPGSLFPALTLGIAYGRRGG